MGCCQSDDSSGGLISVSGPSNNVKQPLLSKEDKQARERRAAKRQSAVRELIETEKTYVRGLDKCIREYFDGLALDQKIISSDDHRKLFSDIKTIYSLNSTFLEDLSIRYESFDNKKTMFGDQFVKFCPYFKMYQNYCNNYDTAMVTYQKMQQKKAFQTYILEARDKCSGSTLQSLLILPIQRLPRYKLCLTEIVKSTENSHPDLINLRRALELVAETTTLINDRMKEYESRQLVRDIENRFGGASQIQLVKPHRKFVHECIMIKVDKTGKDREYYFFLFNDQVMYGSGSAKESLKLHTVLPIDRAFFIQDVPHHEKYSDRAFEVHSSVKSFIVHAKEYKFKKEFMSKISKVVSDRVRLQPGKTQCRELAAPLMVPDDWSDECQMKDCDTKFSFMNRRHHCRYCGKLICSKCGKYKLASRLNSDRVVKPVCKICFKAFGKTHKAKENAKEEVDDANDSNDSNSDDDQKDSK